MPLGHHDCMRLLDVARVYAAALEQLRRRRRKFGPPECAQRSLRTRIREAVVPGASRQDIERRFGELNASAP